MFVQAGDELQFGRYSVEVRETPGHTNGKNKHNSVSHK